MLDFKELAGNGRGLEQLVRELLLIQGFSPQWSGEGPDGGRDLTFDEPGLELLGTKPRKWLVSCKDNSTSGAAVGADAAGGLLEVPGQHDADAFLLVCTTHPSAGLVERLRGVETNGRAFTHVWDGVTLERLLRQPAAWPLAQHFMPVSADAEGWKIFGTDAPNTWIAVHRGFFIRLSARTATGMGYDFESLDLRFDEIARVEGTAGYPLRVREIFHNDTHGAGYMWYLDCLWDGKGPAPDTAQLVRALNSGIVREDGQSHAFEMTVQRVNTYSDHFDRDHYQYYRPLNRR